MRLGVWEQFRVSQSMMMKVFFPRMLLLRGGVRGCERQESEALQDNSGSLINTDEGHFYFDRKVAGVWGTERKRGREEEKKRPGGETTHTRPRTLIKPSNMPLLIPWRAYYLGVTLINTASVGGPLTSLSALLSSLPRRESERALLTAVLLMSSQLTAATNVSPTVPPPYLIYSFPISNPKRRR